MTPIKICRYEEIEAVLSELDPLTDLITWLEYYSSIEYVTKLLTQRHGVAINAAKRRARLVSSHARLAREYIDQALTGPKDVAFLPIYYAILNLLKIYVLFGPHHALLPSNRWHGASYDGYAKNSQTLLTERITVHPGGTIPLFYQTVTGRRILRKTSLQLSDVYPYLMGVTAEYRLAAGTSARIASLQFDLVTIAKKTRLRAMVGLRPGIALPPVSQLKPLIGFKKNSDGHFISRPITKARPLLSHVRPFLLYHQTNGEAATRISGSHFYVPEELPIVLAFFHMSSVVRYKPEFLARLKDSKYWPLLSSARRYSLLQFLMAFWSFTHKKTLMINPPDIHRLG